MKLDGFAYNNPSLFKEDNSLKLKSFVGMKKTINLKSLIMILALVFVNFSLKAQNVDSSISKETIETTTVLLKELERKVSLTKSIELELTKENISPTQKEDLLTKLYNSKKDIIVYVSHSLEERCTNENRLLEISKIVKPLDSKMSEKFEILHEENQSTNR